jgi:uncharacterized 2Fe-2S/4Fe-4S cluster protein (DUF4445 family)
MTKSLKVEFLPFETAVHVPPGTSLLEAATKAGLPLRAGCGGKGTCGDCVVQVRAGRARSRPSAALPDELSRQGYVLACETEVLDHLTVELPQFQEISIRSLMDLRCLEENKDNLSGVFEVRPLVARMDLALPPPSVEDHVSDLERVLRAISRKAGIEEAAAENAVLRKLAAAVRDQDGRIDAVLLDGRQGWTILDVEPRRDGRRICGVACDVGTTTVALYLVDMETGEILGAAASYNQQLKCGEDVISRIDYARKPERLEELQGLAASTVNHLVEQAARAAGVSASDIYYGSFAGNTTMTHLFLGLPPRHIREEPYVPTAREVPRVAARELGLSLNPQARIQFAPAVGSYVGGDITAGLLATPVLRDSDTVSLFIDAGTNGELVVGNRDWLVACACSAGPAFEGGGMKCGMPAGDGAIETLEIGPGGQVHYQVIGGGRPRGLCGSGLVDLLAELLIRGLIDKSGKLNEAPLGPRLVRSDDGAAFLIEEAARCAWGRDLVITERDIANLVRTKGAVFSACSVLLKNVGLTFDQIGAFYIAGGFGQHLGIESAIRIGLLPDLPRDKFHYLGNTSLCGAYLILLSGRNEEMVGEIARKTTYVELNTEPGYMHEYTGALFLPHTDIGLFPTVKKLLAP